MLYSEFIEGTGCRVNPHNYEVYKKLECLYMNWDGDITKQEIYEMGKKLVDNGLTEEQKQHNREIDEKVAEYKREIEWRKDEVDRYTSYVEITSGEERKVWRKHLRESKNYLSQAREMVRVMKTLYIV